MLSLAGDRPCTITLSKYYDKLIHFRSCLPYGVQYKLFPLPFAVASASKRLTVVQMSACVCVDVDASVPGKFRSTFLHPKKR